MPCLTKVIKDFAEGFINYANIGFRYIDIPNYTEKIHYSENKECANKQKISA